ncbi:hypothetical protein ACFRAQ_34795 [Nocardia sp. NPDC056611]|uniref:hypothetical protein n=1 Tax=Nocardia sp. NPDC056611 TaxID=3345877 RepID=UPI00366AEB0F
MSASQDGQRFVRLEVVPGQLSLYASVPGSSTRDWVLFEDGVLSAQFGTAYNKWSGAAAMVDFIAWAKGLGFSLPERSIGVLQGYVWAIQQFVR